MGKKKYLNENVLEAARKRISIIFDNFPKICVSFSGGKDSSVMTHLVMDEAIKRNRRVGLLFIDLEAQYKLTIEHVEHIYEEYKDNIIPFWISLPLHLRNAVSQFEPHWICWEKGREKDWVRTPPKIAITDTGFFPFLGVGMEFEEFVTDFGEWFADERLTACFVGIRTDESLNRYRTLTSSKKKTFEKYQWTTWMKGYVYNIYPIYDWRTEDIWRYNGKFKKSYNELYDRMYQAGLTIHQSRICQPYGNDQRKGLWLYHIIETETWGRVVKRVSGANQGALYAQEKGNILGVGKITKPDGLTWEKYASVLLSSLPNKSKEHFENKILIFLRWWQARGYVAIPDFAEPKLESGTGGKRLPSWRRICKSLLRNDYWCKGLSFSQTKSEAYTKYLKLMKRKRKKWDIKIYR